MSRLKNNLVKNCETDNVYQACNQADEFQPIEQSNCFGSSSISQTGFTEEKAIQLSLICNYVLTSTARYKELLAEVDQNPMKLQATIENFINNLTESTK